MPTLGQLVRGPGVNKVGRRTVPALDGCPFKRGSCLRVFTTAPKKPNSAVRKVARVKLSNGRRITAAIPGIKHSLQEHATVIVRGGRANDLPGVGYKLVGGQLDFSGEEGIRGTHKRSKFGVKKDGTRL